MARASIVMRSASVRWLVANRMTLASLDCLASASCTKTCPRIAEQHDDAQR